MLHLLFMSAQLWGSYNFYKMYQKQCRIIAQKEGVLEDIETATKEAEEEVKHSMTIAVDPAELLSRDGSEIELTEQLRQRS
jgi:hypothetical protein